MPLPWDDPAWESHGENLPGGMNSLNENFRRLAEEAGFVFWTHAEDLHSFQYLSPGFESVYGRTRESLQAQPEQWREAVLPEDEAFFQELFKTSETKQPRHAVYRIARPDGQIRWIEAWCFHEGLTGMARDITAARSQQQEREDTHAELKRTLEARSRFLATISHEVRTPLSGVIGMMGLLLETELTSEQREMAETIQRGGDQALNLISEVLDLSKMEAGKMSLETRDFSLREVVEDAVDLLAEKAHAKGLEILGLVEMNVPTALRGDAGRLAQVLTNLLDNAVKFTERGEVLLRVSRQSQTPSSVRLLFEVKDSGVGLPPETSREIFQPFQQADTSTASRYGGTGLGLAIVKEIVTLMGGDIGVDSEPNKGALFWFTAEFALQSAPAFARRESALVGLRVLTAVKNPMAGQVLRSKLLALGIYPAMAHTKEEMLSMLEKAAEEDIPFDLCILDLRYGEGDNWALTKQIKNLEKIASTPLVLLNVTSTPHRIEEYSEYGVAAVLNEPVRESRLADRLVTVVQSQHKAQLEPPAAPEANRRAEQPRILLAEDNPVNRKVALLQLERLGYQADAVADGTEALDALETNTYDIILMDCLMPQLDGYETTKRIREKHGRTIRIIALTAHALPTDRDKCLAAGMDDYLTKPALISDLKSALERWAPGRKG